MALSRATAIRAALEDGLLSFPVTDFDEQGKFRAATVLPRRSTVCGAPGLWTSSWPGVRASFFPLTGRDYRDIVKDHRRYRAGADYR